MILDNDIIETVSTSYVHLRYNHSAGDTRDENLVFLLFHDLLSQQLNITRTTGPICILIGLLSNSIAFTDSSPNVFFLD